MEKEEQSDGPGVGLTCWFGISSFLALTPTSPIARAKTNHPAPQVSFGVSPAAAAFAIGLRTPVDHLFLTFFVLCGLTRLARFNVTVQALPKDATGKSKYFEGTPIPTTLSIAALMAYWVGQGWTLENIPLGVWAEGTIFEFHPVVGLFVLSGCLMTSKTIHIPKP
jgi:phosphatidylserine synthase